jgi:transcriptional regulator GlxA family with amidase domain
MNVRHRVAVLALDGVMAMDLGIPSQVLGCATDSAGHRLYETRICSPGGGPIRCNAGFTVQPDHDLDLLDWADTVIVPGIHRERLHDFTASPAMTALRAAHDAGKRIMSICTGAYALAAAGLLDDRPAATHWAYADDFRARFPQVKLDAEVLFIDDGDVLTSAGVAAGLDLCLHVVRRDHGSDVANRAARRCVVAPWRDGGQSQFIERPLPAAGDASTAATREWALARLGEPLDLDQLARHARMSVRTFTRRFREETGLSPGRWLTTQRVEHARHLLESTDLSIDQVATAAGFGTAVSLRQHLHAAVGVAPLTYRRTFRRSAA